MNKYHAYALKRVEKCHSQYSQILRNHDLMMQTDNSIKEKIDWISNKIIDLENNGTSLYDPFCDMLNNGNNANNGNNGNNGNNDNNTNDLF